jgi:hypothetical protein
MSVNFLSHIKKENYLLLIFAVFFYSSWLYGLQALGEWSFHSFKIIKTIFTLLLMAGIAYWILPIKVKFDNLSKLVLVWIALCFYQWFHHPDDSVIYIRRIGQILFFWLLVNGVSKYCISPFDEKYFHRWFSSELLSVIVLIATFLYWFGWIFDDVMIGFGNSRVNFSIWLMQLIALILIAKDGIGQKSSKQGIYILILLTPICALQVMSGGRSGLVGTMLLVIYFFYRRLGLIGIVLSVSWLLSLTLFIIEYSPQITPENNLNVFRNLALTGSNQLQCSDNTLYGLQNWMVYLDRVSSCRISIIVTAFSSMALQDWLLGVGVGKFTGWAPAYLQLGMMEVHNVLLKISGEYGIFGFIISFLIVMMGLCQKKGLHSFGPMQYVQLVYLIVSMVHPDLMFTAINTSIVYIVCYGMSQRKISITYK